MKLADFGAARQLDRAEAAWSQDWSGSPGYWAPEVEQGYKLLGVMENVLARKQKQLRATRTDHSVLDVLSEVGSFNRSNFTQTNQLTGWSEDEK